MSTILSQKSLGSGVCVLVVDHDPVTSVTQAMKGDIIIRDSDRVWFMKLDNGSTINVSQLTYKHNYMATTNPTVNDDIDAGYKIGGSVWLNTLTSTFFRCAKDTAGAAVWV